MLETIDQQEKVPYEILKLNIHRDRGDLLAFDPPISGLGRLLGRSQKILLTSVVSHAVRTLSGV